MRRGPFDFPNKLGRLRGRNSNCFRLFLSFSSKSLKISIRLVKSHCESAM